MNLMTRVLRRAFWIICKFLPVKKNKIVFQSYYGRGYGDNPKYIAEALYKKGNNIDFVWVVNGIEDPNLPSYFRPVLFRGFHYIYEMSTAKIWVDNSRKEFCIKKRNQYYMQTWHGGFTLKKIEKSVEAELESNYVRQAKLDAKLTDVMLSNCTELTDIYRKDFWYENGEILECGLPRNDRLFNFTQSDVESIRRKVGIPDGVHCLLYAPTFRKDKGLKAYDLDYKGCCEALEKRFGGSWKILLRLHPNIFSKSNDLKLDGEYVINASYYPDIQELYVVSDLLITDYSSVIFDFMLLDRPAFLYANDISDYMQDRGFYISLSDLPFPLSENNAEMISTLENFDRKEYDIGLENFRKEQKFFDNGSASESAAEWILNHMK